MLEDKLEQPYRPNSKIAVGTPYGLVSGPNSEYNLISQAQVPLYVPTNYTSSVNLNYSPGSAVIEESIYGIDTRNTVRDQNGKVIAVFGGLLGYMDPNDETGTLRVHTVGDSVPAPVRKDVKRHEERHDYIHNEEENRAQDRAEDGASYNWYFQQ